MISTRVSAVSNSVTACAKAYARALEGLLCSVPSRDTYVVSIIMSVMVWVAAILGCRRLLVSS